MKRAPLKLILSLISISITSHVYSADFLEQSSSCILRPYKQVFKSGEGHESATLDAIEMKEETHIFSAIPNFFLLGIIKAVEIDLTTALNIAIEKADNDQHREAYPFFQLVARDPDDTYAKFQIANYLTYGIRGYLEPNLETRREAAALYVQAARIELKNLDTPNHAGRKVEGLSKASYEVLLSGQNERAASLLISVLEKEPKDYY